MKRLDASGLSIYMDPEALHLSFVDTPGAVFQRPEYSVRTFEKLAPILEDPGSVTGHEQEIVYFMFRNLGLKGNEDLLKTYSLRYDMSLFRQHLFGQELMKTSGHYHPAIWTGGCSYPEVYEVAHGRAIFLMQEVDDIHAGPDDVEVRSCIALECEEGQKAVMPANFGHVTINPDPNNVLVTTNWVCSDFASVYGGAERCRGFAWYRTEDRGWVANPHLKRGVPRLRHARCAEVPELGLVASKGLYEIGAENPELMAFLKRPQDFTPLIWAGIEFRDAEDEHWKQEYIARFSESYPRR